MNYTFTCDNFDARQILFCGQSFRWSEADGVFSGFARDRYLTLTQSGNEITLQNIDKQDIDFWREYFDLDTDYGELIRRFSEDKLLKQACAEKSGIRVLRQDPFEMLISFIISQNNNIKRIGGIIQRLCEGFGSKTPYGYAFPTPNQLYGVTAEDLAPLRAGFRAKYIADAMQKIQSGEVDLQQISPLPIDNAREELKKICGVGDKVADCVLLFGYHKTEAFPRDVWIKKVTAKFYPDGLPECIKGYEGIAQQYMFDYARTLGI